MPNWTNNWLIKLVSAVILVLKSKFIIKYFEFIVARLSLGFWFYTFTAYILQQPIFDVITYSTDLRESKKMLFNIHNLHRKYNMSGKIDFVLGYPCSLNKLQTLPANLMRKEYLNVGLRQIDKDSPLGLDSSTRKHRVREIMTDKYLGFLFDFQIDAQCAYFTTICLTATTGSVFTEAIYKTCIGNLITLIIDSGFDSSKLNDGQIENMIYVSSCLLPTSELGEKHRISLTDYFNNAYTNKPSEIAQLCYDEILTYTRSL